MPDALPTMPYWSRCCLHDLRAAAPQQSSYSGRGQREEVAWLKGAWEKKKNRVSQQTLMSALWVCFFSVTGHLIHIIFQSCKISLILSEVDIHSSTPQTHSAHYKISSVSPHTDGPGSWASQIRETGGRGTERVMEKREKAREERTHSIYAARYEQKRYEKIYCEI